MGARSDPRRVLRVGTGPVGWRPDQVAVEAPLSLVIDGAVVATTMRTPGHDVELALGWLVGEGVLARRDDVVAVRAGDERTVEIALAPGAQPPGRRLGVTVSACGLCGVDDLDAVAARLDSAARADGATSVDGEVQRRYGRAFSAEPQETFDAILEGFQALSAFSGKLVR